MLVLERKEGEGVWIGRHIRVEVREIRNRSRVKLCIVAPRELTVLREEIAKQPELATPPGTRVWVIDDSDADVHAIRLALESCGVAELSVFANGDEVVAAADAVEQGELAAPTLVLIDYEMPGLCGAKVLAALRAKPALRFTPMLMLSGHTESDIVSETLKMGANAYVRKGDTLDDVLLTLARTIAFWCDGQRLQPN